MLLPSFLFGKDCLRYLQQDLPAADVAPRYDERSRMGLCEPECEKHPLPEPASLRERAR